VFQIGLSCNRHRTPKSNERFLNVNQSGRPLSEQLGVTTPTIGCRIFNQSGRHGVQMNIGEELPVVVLVPNHPGFVSALP
jgi:hypothetical protein